MEWPVDREPGTVIRESLKTTVAQKGQTRTQSHAVLPSMESKHATRSSAQSRHMIF